MNSASSTIPCRASSSLISRCSHYVCQIVVWRANLEVTHISLTGDYLWQNAATDLDRDGYRALNLPDEPGTKVA